MLPYQLQMMALESFDISPPRMMNAGSADSIIGFVEAGLGYSLVPSLDNTGPKTKGIVAKPISRPKVAFPVHMAWRKDMPENPLFETLLKFAPQR